MLVPLVLNLPMKSHLRSG